VKNETQRRGTTRSESPRRNDYWSPRFALGWASLTFAVCTLALGFPALLGGFLVNPRSDQFYAGYAFREFAASSLKAGHGIPLWNPYLMGGTPYVAAMAGDLFYPTFLLRVILPTDVAMTWSFMIHVFLAGLFTYLFLRAWGLGFLPSVIGGVAYLMCGPLAAYVSPGHDGKLYVSALLPLALFVLVRGIRDGRNWAWGALALVIGLGVLSPHPQLLQYMLLACGAFALYLAFAELELPDGTRLRLDRRVGTRRLLYALGAVLLGAVIGAIQFLPVREYVPYSPRAGGRDYDYSTSFSLPIEEMINFYLPEFSGILDRYWGRNTIHLHSEYLGAATLFLGTIGLTSERRGFRWFWIGTFIVALLWALGGNTPFFHIVYALIPGTKFFRAPSTMLFMIGFSVAVLAALGAERLLLRAVSFKYAAWWLGAAGLVAVLASVGGLTSLAKMISYSWAGDQADDFISSNNGAMVVGAWRAFLVIGLAALLVWLLDQRRLERRAIGIAFVALIALDLFSVEKQYWLFSPPASKLYASDPALDYVRNQPEPGRVFAQPLAQLGTRDVMLLWDGPMVDRVRLITGYHGNEIGRFQHLCGATPDTRCDISTLLSPSFWRHENVQYLYTNADTAAISQLSARLNVPPIKRLVGPVTDAAGTQVYLYRLPGDNPAAWLAPVFVKAPEDQAYAAVLNPQFDPTRVAILDTNSSIPAQQITAPPPPLNIPVRVTRYAPGEIQLEVASPPPAGTALIVSENYFPGWTASVDGKGAPVDRVQYNLIGVQLPGNARQVELRFHDAAYQRGKLITILALLGCLVLLVLGIVTSRGTNVSNTREVAV
jgi:Bacterial membrane protein YfhO